MAIYGINISTEEYEKILGYLLKPRSKHDIMFKFGFGASKAYDLLSVLISAEEVKKIKTSSGKTLFVNVMEA